MPAGGDGHERSLRQDISSNRLLRDRRCADHSVRLDGRQGDQKTAGKGAVRKAVQVPEKIPGRRHGRCGVRDEDSDFRWSCGSSAVFPDRFMAWKDHGETGYQL